MWKRSSFLLGIVLVAAVARPGPAAADPPPIPPPSSLASIGDSITRGTNAFGWYGDHPSLSWSTGFNPIDGLQTHYERLLSEAPSIWGNELNVAHAGATMADAPAQAAEVVARGADYVTFLLGANDVCAPTTAEMTSVEAFGRDLDLALDTIATGLPHAKILVASIPNLGRLAQVYRDDPVARFVWSRTGLCPTVLGSEVTWPERLQADLRLRAFNLLLEAGCEAHANCRFDGYAVYGYAFDREEVSRLDYFHPSLDGQRALAELTWSRSWWVS